MPAPRKPTALLVASGDMKHNPGRHADRANEPDTGRGVGPAPEYLDEAQRAIWDEIVGDCAPGVFQSSDRLMLKALVTLESEFRSDPAGFGGRKYERLVALLVKCGMTPADRSRVSVPNGKDERPKTGLASFRR